jgi:two-component system sensor histidine kinase/response regulator
MLNVHDETAVFREAVRRRSDGLMNYFLPGFFVLGAVLANFYGTWGVALGVGGICLLAFYGTRYILPGSDLYQYVLSGILGVFMAQYIYQMHGLFEMHFFAFIGSAILITYQNWKLQIPILVVVLLHHAAFGYLQNSGYTNVYFTQLNYFDLQTFIIHIGLSAVIFFTCGLWSYQLSKYSEIQIGQAMDMGRIQQEALRAEEARQQEARRQAAALEGAIAQGKFEMAADVLHDIGNAVVGFGSYLVRVRRLQESSQTEKLQKLSELFKTERTSLEAALGQTKAGAIATLLDGVSRIQKNNEEELDRSVSEQSGIISRIEEILNIQRHYIHGREGQERRPVQLEAILNDCLAMQQAALVKRGIAVKSEIQQHLPLIKGDQTKLMQVILRILKSSIEALELTQGEKLLSVQLTVKEGMLVLELQDTGRRIASSNAEPGTSADSRLDWASCQAIVESHAGMLTVSDEATGQLTRLAFAV